MSELPMTPFRELLNIIDKQIIELIKASSGMQKEEVLRLAERYVKMRASLVEPYRRGPLTPLERSQL